ncbi:MAG: DUF4252 domain-containing protein [Terriglobales bacterium]
MHTHPPRSLIALLGVATWLVALPCAAVQAPGARLILNLDHLASKATETTDVTLDGSLLKMAGRFLSKDKPDQASVKDLVGNLKGVYVRSYEFDKDGQYTDADIAPIRAQLKNAAWSRIVGVESKRDRETSEIYVQTAGNQADGQIVALAIISAEPRELTVVNIVGPMNLDQLSELGGHMGIPRVAVGPDHKPATARQKKSSSKSGTAAGKPTEDLQ